MTEISQVSSNIKFLSSVGTTENKWIAASYSRLDFITFNEDENQIFVTGKDSDQRNCAGTEKSIYLLKDSVEVYNLDLELQKTIDVSLSNFWADTIDGQEYLLGINEDHICYGETLTELLAADSPKFAKQFINTVYISNSEKLALYDLRTKKERCSINIKDIRTFDINQNLSNILVTGDDQKVKVWDIRKLTTPLLEIYHHSHWIETVRFNKYHDQLLLTSSTDSSIILESISSCSSSPEIIPDGLLQQYDELDDSVYGTEWSLHDPWIFCAVSYSGRVLVSTVSQEIRYKILGISIEDE